jgi:hypothetical protein
MTFSDQAGAVVLHSCGGSGLISKTSLAPTTAGVP